jgi:drug/metabolite transporter (DMT)-like permease
LHLKNPRTLAHLLLLATVFVWGATFVLVKNALADASPLLFNLMRMGLATLALIAMNFRQLRSVTRGQLGAGAVAGVFLAAGYQFQTMGLTETTPAKSAFLTGLVVVFVPALTLVPAFRPAGTSAPGANTAIGALLAFAGLILITTPPGTVLRHLFASIGAGDLLTLLCAVAFAAHLLTLARVSKGIPAGVLATLQVGFCAAAMLITLPLERPHVSFTPRLWITLAVCSLFATAAAFTIQSFAQQVLPPTHTVVLLTLEPVFAWLTGLLVLHQSLDRRSLIGAGLIMAGIVVIEMLHATHTTEIPA